MRSSIQHLSNFFSGNGNNIIESIPSYDQKYYVESIDKLIESIEKKKTGIAGVKKFSFKNRTSLSAVKKTQNSEDSSLMTQIQPFIKNIENQTYLVPDTSPKSLYIQGIVNSKVITPSSTTPYSVHLSNLKNSQILISSDSSIFIEDLHDCQIFTRSLQLRLHDVINCTVIPLISNDSNRIIIENCKELKLGKLGNSFVEVDDFKMPNKTKKNPNYDFLKDDDDIYEDMKPLLEYNNIYRV